jgi:signal transduction histidine kinase
MTIAALTPDFLSDNGLSLALLEVSLAALCVLEPLYGPDGAELVDFTLSYLNPAGQRLLGLPARPARPLGAGFPPAVAGGLLSCCRAAFQSGEPGGYDAPYSADSLNHRFRAAAQRHAGLLLLSFSSDCPADAAVLEALRATQAREHAALAEAEAQRLGLEELLLQAPALIAVLSGPDHVYTLVNRHYQELFGSSRPLLGYPSRQALPELIDQPFFGFQDAVYRTGEPCYGREVAARIDRHHDGVLHEAYFNFTYQATRDARGTITGVLVFAHDVTEQVRARYQLQQLNTDLEARVAERTQTALHDQETAEMQRSRLERLLQAMPAAICILSGPTLVHELVNPSYQRLFADRSLLGEPLQTAVPELADVATYQQLRQVYETGAIYRDSQRLITTRAPNDIAQDRYFHSMFKPRRDEHGHIDGLVIFAFEITELVRGRQQIATLNQQLLAANDALTASNQQLTRANADLANFIYTASHDLKTPISNIEGLLHALQRELSPAVLQSDHVQAMFDMMQGAVERFQLTISHLTDVARLQQAHAEPAEPVDLAALVEAVRLDLVPALAAAGAQLSVDVAGCPHVSFALKNLRSIVYNLLSNAVKYAAPGRAPEVTLRAYRAPDGAAAVLEVQDNGLGLSKGQQAKLFGLFQRLHTHVEGSGIGLYMVKKIVENAGGTITVHSQPGVGSTFTVMLPD